MKLVVQRVNKAQVEVDGKIVGKINKGFMVLCGITHDDTEKQADILARKLCNLRVFEDENEKMNLSIKDINGQILVISQFTLFADCKKGNRPSFTNAGSPEHANKLYEYFIKQIENQQIEVEHGIFGENMKVSLTNDGPVTIILEA